MVIFHSYVNVYQGVAIDRYGQFQLVDGSRRVFGGMVSPKKQPRKQKTKSSHGRTSLASWGRQYLDL